MHSCSFLIAQTVILHLRIITQIRGLYQTVPERSITSVFNYASAAVMIAMEYTSDALHPRDKSLIGAFRPNKIGP